MKKESAKKEIEKKEVTKKTRVKKEPEKETIVEEIKEEKVEKREVFNIALIKRVLAYFIDFVIVVIITSLLSGIKALNPKYDEYRESYTKYVDMYNAIVDSEEQDYTITPELESVMYDVARYSVSYTIIECSVIVLYFTLFPLAFNGQTIGKKILKLRIVSKNDGKVGFFNYLLRAIVYPLFSGGMFYCTCTLLANFIAVVVFKQKYFVDINKAVLLVGIIWGYIDMFSCVFRKDNKPIHDLLSGTKVEYIGQK